LNHWRHIFFVVLEGIAYKVLEIIAAFGRHRRVSRAFPIPQPFHPFSGLVSSDRLGHQQLFRQDCTPGTVPHVWLRGNTEAGPVAALASGRSLPEPA
jgi:hypothetical protein